MIYIILFLVWLSGLSLVHFLPHDYNISERIGYSGLLGMGLTTLTLFLFNFVGIPINIPTVFAATLLLIIGFHIPIIKNEEARSNLQAQYASYSFKFRGINFLWWGALAAILYLSYAILMKNHYWPAISYDTIAGYDLMAKVVADQGHIVNDYLFDETGKAIGGSAHRLTYPFLVPGALSLAYLSGLAMSKIITSYFYISFLFAFYGAARRHVNATLAILGLLFMLLSPEFYSYGSLVMTNLPQAMYMGIGVILLIAWLRNRERPYFWLAAIFLAFNIFTRSEGVVLSGIISGVILFDCWGNKSWKDAAYFFAIMLAPFILWQLFLMINGLETATKSQSLFVHGLVVDSAKFDELIAHVKFIIPRTDFYGLTLYAFGLFLVANIYFIITKKVQLNLVYILIVGFFGYTLMFYQIDYSWDSFRNVMYYSYKRGLFCFIPIVWFFVIDTTIARAIFERYERLIYEPSRRRQN